MKLSKEKLSDYLIFTSSVDFSLQRKDAKKVLLISASIAGILSFFREMGREYLDRKSDIDQSSQIDILGLLIIGFLTFSFYTIILLPIYKFACKSDNIKENYLLTRIALVTQLAIIRDFLFIVWMLLFLPGPNAKYSSDRSNYNQSEQMFLMLETALWFLTVFFILPPIREKLKENSETDDSQVFLSIIVTLIIFWMAFLINFVILNLLISLPLNRGI